MDSQAKYGALARGDGATYLRFPHQGYREKIWDHAAGCIVVTGEVNCLFLSLRWFLLISSVLVGHTDAQDPTFINGF